MRNFLAIAAATALISGCATPFPHGPGTHGRPGMDMQAMERMHDHMHERMAAARTPGERETMMQEHHKMMREHMQGKGDMCGGMGGRASQEAGAHKH